MTEAEYRKEITNLVFDAPRSEIPSWPKWKLPTRELGERPEQHLRRMRRFKERYFETVRKLEHGRALTWL